MLTPVDHFDAALAAVVDGAAPTDAAAALVASMTPEEKLWCLDGDLPGLTGLVFVGVEDGYHRSPFFAAVVDRVGIAGVAFADGPRGSVLFNATCFPVTMARGATWDPELEERVGAAIGAELRAGGANLTGAVCVNVLRHPAWGRAQETYGEDPFHVGEMGAAFTRGLQRHVMACVKHYACNSMENSRFKVDVAVDEVALHEVYLPHFRAVVDAGVASVMSAYNMVNGEWAAESRELLTDILRGEWGFEGFTISDWVFGLRDAAKSLHAGLDIEMPARLVRAHELPAALEDGTASWDDVDKAVTRIVATLLRFHPILSNQPSTDVIGSADHRALAREVASRSAVLLRNDPVNGSRPLPLAGDQTVALVGRLADVINTGDAGSSDVWDLHCTTIADGLRATADVTVASGTDPETAAAAAASADVAIVVVGYTALDEGEFMGDLDSLPTVVFPEGDEPEVVERFERWKTTVPIAQRPHRVGQADLAFGAGGDRSSLRLPADDVALIRAVAAANANTVVVIQSGSAVVMSDWIDVAPAVVQSWYAGAEAGPALADVLTGERSPSGRLPFTIPVDEADLPAFESDASEFTYDRWHGWWHLARAGRAAAFPFGFGLTYADLFLTSSSVSADAGSLVARTTVHNTGDREVSEVVQVYGRKDLADAPARLIGFTRVDVPAGHAVEVELTIDRARLETRDAQQHRWAPAQGRHLIRVARHSEDPTAVDHPVDL